MSTNTKIVCIGDPHFQTNNLPEVNIFVKRLLQLLTENPPDIIIVLGDLLHEHERLHTTPLNVAYDFIKNLRNISPTYVLVGNHDMTSNIQYLTTNHWMNAMKQWENTTIVDTVKYIHKNGKKFILTPYVSPSRFMEALNTGEEDWKDADCIFAHQEFFGCKMGAIISVEGDKWPLDYPEVISGHIHSNQRPQKNIYYPGSSLQHAFGESEKNVVSIATFTEDKKGYELEEIDLKLPRKKIVYMDIEDVIDYKVPETEDKLKITVSGIYEQFKSFKKTKKYKKLIKSGVKVIFKQTRVEIKKEKEKDYSSGETDFSNILNTLVTEYKDPHLIKAYELVVNNRKV